MNQTNPNLQHFVAQNPNFGRFGALFTGGKSMAQPIKKEAPPNILVIMADQWRGDCLGGHPVAQTPHLDKMAG